MRTLLSLLVVTSTGLAQTSNLFEIYSGCTNFTSRGDLGTAAGELLLQVPCSHFVGVGQTDGGSGTQISGLRYVLQDQNGATQEPYDVIIRADNHGVPNCTPAGLRVSVGPLRLPVSSGTIAWLVTTALATTGSAVPRCDTFYLGAALPAAANWTHDGLSLHMSTYELGDRPAPGTPSLAWDCRDGQPSQPAAPQTRRLGALTGSALLNLGNLDRTWSISCNPSRPFVSFGAGGMWPHFRAGAREDGLDCRIRDGEHARGVFAVVAGTSTSCTAIRLPGLARGALYLNPAAPLAVVAQGVLDVDGEGMGTILPPGSAAAGSVRNRYVHFQALTVASSAALPVKLSNRASAIYR